MRRREPSLSSSISFGFIVITVAVVVIGSANGGELLYSKLSGIIIPGFASTQLRAWSILDCPYSPLDFNPLDLVWLDSTKMLSAVNCWLKCILLDPYNQTDHPECKSRPDSGLSAITELDPGYITGPLSSVWKEWIKWCIEFGIEANAILAVPYDWRLSPSMLEERDLYFHKLKSYHGDPVLNPLTPWERPPIRNIFCIYGIDSKTEVGYYFAPSGKPYPDNWIITDIIYEFEGSLFSRSGNLVEGHPGVSSGDETSEHDGSDVQVELNVDHHHDADIVPNMKRSSRVKYITYFEDSESIPGRRTAVWELDKANHRNIVRSPVLMRELWLQMWHDIHPDTNSKFVTKAKRGPLRDGDCYWDYGKARCAWPDYCEYRYIFGDVHLGQSCRLKNSSADLLLHYV